MAGTRVGILTVKAWYFNPLAWQFLFVIGATAGYLLNGRQTLPQMGAWLSKLAVVITSPIGIISIFVGDP